MSNFSNIGFIVSTQEDLGQLLEKATKLGKIVPCEDGKYVVYSDKSGAELWIQINKKNKIIGVNPHFKGESKRKVCLTTTVSRTVAFDGAFHAWAEPIEENNPNGGLYPFVFDSPDFKSIGTIDFPHNYDMQLSAFPRTLNIFDNEEAFKNSQTTEWKMAAESFIPSGLFELGDTTGNEPTPALAVFAGTIKAFEIRTNSFTNEDFYWLLVQTLGGEVDIVADKRFFIEQPKINGIVKGEFWLSGQIINVPKVTIENKSFFKRLFG